MNPTDADIAEMKEELSQAVYLIGKYLNETPLGNQPHMIAGIAEQWLEQRRKRALVVRFTVEEFQNWIHASPLTRIPIPNKSIDHIVKAIADTKHGIAATTERHRKVQG